MMEVFWNEQKNCNNFISFSIFLITGCDEVEPRYEEKFNQLLRSEGINDEDYKEYDVMSYHKANALGTGDVDRYYIYKNSFDNLIAIKYKKKYDETKKNEYGISPLECYIAEVYIDVEEAEVNKKMH